MAIAFRVTIKVRLILYHRGQILLLKQTKPNGGNYTLVGGTIEPGESAKESLIRESYEEAGIQLRAQDLELVHLYEKVSRNKEHRIVMYFKAYTWQGELRSREPRKFLAAEWFDLDELPSNLTETVRHVIDEYRKGSTYSVLKT